MPEDRFDEQQTSEEYQITGMDVLKVIAGTLLVLFLGFVVVWGIMVAIVTADGTIPSQEELTKMAEGGVSSLPLGVKALALVVQSLLVLPAILFLRKKKLSIRTHLRLHTVPGQLLLLSLGIGVGIAIVGDEFSRLMDYILPMPEEFLINIQEMVKLKSLGDVLTMGLTVALIAPIGEELLFRGFFQRFFENRRGVTSGVLSASALFAAYHFNIYWLIPILLMATVMGAMAWRTESIMPSIVVHATNNTASLITANTMVEEPAWYTMGSHVSPLVLVPALLLLILCLRAFFKNAEDAGLGGHGPRGDVGNRVNQVI